MDEPDTFVPAADLKTRMLAQANNYALDFYNSLFQQGFEVTKNVATDGRVYDRIRFAEDFWRYLCGVALAYNASSIVSGPCAYMPQDLAELLAYNEDAVQYRSYGRYTPTKTSYKQSCLLHNDMQAGFENYVAGKSTTRAHLRFGHMETLLPYLSNMGFAPRDPYFLQDSDWKNREFNTYIAHMSANIQLLLYKCNGNSPTYYVKMLLNEEEVVIPGCDSVYCPWEQYKSLAATWRCNNDQFKELCNGLIVFCGTTREIALSQQRTAKDNRQGPSALGFGSSAFDDFGPFSAKRYRAPPGAASIPGMPLGGTPRPPDRRRTGQYRRPSCATRRHSQNGPQRPSRAPPTCPLPE